MDDDFNTPQALGVLFDLARLLQGAREQGDDAGPAGAFVIGVGRLVDARAGRSVSSSRGCGLEPRSIRSSRRESSRCCTCASRRASSVTSPRPTGCATSWSALGVTLKDSRDGDQLDDLA